MFKSIDEKWQKATQYEIECEIRKRLKQNTRGLKVNSEGELVDLDGPSMFLYTVNPWFVLREVLPRIHPDNNEAFIEAQFSGDGPGQLRHTSVYDPETNWYTICDWKTLNEASLSICRAALQMKWDYSIVLPSTTFKIGPDKKPKTSSKSKTS